MPRRTCSTSAPTRSQSSATWFMNEIRDASIAFAAYLVSSADAMSITRSGLPVRRYGRVELLHRLARLGAVHADDDPVRLHEVVHRPALLQELGIRRHDERMIGARADLRADPLRCPHRHRGLGDDDLGLVEMIADGPRRGEHLREVRRATLLVRRADRDDHDLAVLDRRGEIGREMEPPLRLVLPNDAASSPGS